MTKILITSVSKKMIIFASVIENEENSEHKKPYQYLLEMPSPFIIVMTLTSGADPGFHRRGSGGILGNAIFDVLRPSHGALRSRFFKPKCQSYYYFTISSYGI